MIREFSLLVSEGEEDGTMEELAMGGV